MNVLPPEFTLHGEIAAHPTRQICRIVARQQELRTAIDAVVAGLEGARDLSSAQSSAGIVAAKLIDSLESVKGSTTVSSSASSECSLRSSSFPVFGHAS